MNRNESEETKPEGERLLRELCEVCPEWKRDPHLGYKDVIVLRQERTGGILFKGDHSNIRGGESLWSMLQEMRERWDFLIQVGPRGWCSGFGQEYHALHEMFINTAVTQIAASRVLECYIAWKRVCLPTALASKTENL